MIRIWKWLYDAKPLPSMTIYGTYCRCWWVSSAKLNIIHHTCGGHDDVSEEYCTEIDGLLKIRVKYYSDINKPWIRGKCIWYRACSYLRSIPPTGCILSWTGGEKASVWAVRRIQNSLYNHLPSLIKLNWINRYERNRKELIYVFADNYPPVADN